MTNQEACCRGEGGSEWEEAVEYGFSYGICEELATKKGGKRPRKNDV